MHWILHPFIFKPISQAQKLRRNDKKKIPNTEQHSAIREDSQNTTPCKDDHLLTDLREIGLGEEKCRKGQRNRKDQTLEFTSVSKSLLVRKLCCPALVTISHAGLQFAGVRIISLNVSYMKKYTCGINTNLYSQIFMVVNGSISLNTLLESLLSPSPLVS